jgi:hypothetical protein
MFARIERIVTHFDRYAGKFLAPPVVSLTRLNICPFIMFVISALSGSTRAALLRSTRSG